MTVKSFTVYSEYDDLVDFLETEEEKAQLVYSFWKYMFKNILPTNLNNKQLAIFNNLKRPLDKSKTKSKNKLNKIKTKSNKNQNEIENNSKNNQNKNTSDVNVNVNNINNINTNNYVDNYIEEKEINKEKEDLNFELINVATSDKEQEILDFINQNNININPANYNELVEKYLNHLEPMLIKKALLLGNNKPFGYVRAILADWLIKKLENNQKKKSNVPEWLNKDIESSSIIEENDFEFKEFIKEFRKGEKKL